MAEFVQSKIIAIEPDGIILVSPEILEKLFDDFAKIPKNKRVNVGRIKKRFLWWPRWTPDDEIYAWFDKMYPGGLLELARKRQIKRFGKDYVKTWEKIGKRMRSAGASYFLSTPPDLARTRELQANLRGQRAFLQTVDDAACLTEEDKKRAEERRKGETLQSQATEQLSNNLNSDGQVVHRFEQISKGLVQ